MRHDVEVQNHKNRRVQLVHEAEADRLAAMQPAAQRVGGLPGQLKRFGIVITLLAILLAGSQAIVTRACHGPLLDPLPMRIIRLAPFDIDP